MYITYKLIHREGFCASSSFKSSQRVCLYNNINLRELFSFPENKITRIQFIPSVKRRGLLRGVAKFLLFLT